MYGLVGRALLYAMFVRGDFQKLYDYQEPDCGEDDLWGVLAEHWEVLWGQGGKREVERFRYKLEASVACLTEVPDEFPDLDILTTGLEGKRLKDRLGDLVDIVKSRRL